MSITRLKSLFNDFIGTTTPCEVCRACDNVVPGSVNPHAAHVLIRLSPPAGHEGSKFGPDWWPTKVDDHPAIEATTDAIKQHIPDKIKVTAFEYPDVTAESLELEGTHDVFIFPACILLRAVPRASLPDAIVAALKAVPVRSLLYEGALPNDLQVELLDDPVFVVCCHTARDKRCGYLGPPLANKLSELGCRVLLSSHIGGHQYAGNVIVNGRSHPANGTWFGGLEMESAEEFAKAIKSLPLSENAAGNTVLRKWWRGRVGLSKEDQMKHYKQCAKLLRDIEQLGADVDFQI